MELYDKTMSLLEKRRDRIINGSVNCIPSPFKRFSEDFTGIEQDTYYCVTSFTKGGKSMLTSFVFIYQLIMFSYFSKEEVPFKIIYFPLEETKERIMQRFMSWLLYHFSKGQIRVSPKELRSTTKPVSKEVLERLRQFDIQDLLQFFEEHIIFPTESPNPTGIYKFCKQYAEEHGTVKTRIVKIKDEFGVPHDTDVFESYEQDNPDEYRLIIIDTINLPFYTDFDIFESENIRDGQLYNFLAKGKSLKRSDPGKFGKYGQGSKLLYTLLTEVSESEGNEAFKLGRIRPSVAGLGDSKYTSRDANVVLGLFSPYRFGITEYFNYDITILKDHIRFLEVIVNRDGEMGGLLPLWFDGAVCDFKELPKPEDKVAMSKVYNYCKQLEQRQQQTTTKTALFLNKAKERIMHFINLNLNKYD